MFYCVVFITEESGTNTRRRVAKAVGIEVGVEVRIPVRRSTVRQGQAMPVEFRPQPCIQRMREDPMPMSGGGEWCLRGEWDVMGRIKEKSCLWFVV